MRFRPSKRALGKLNEGHPDARDSPAVLQLRYPSAMHRISTQLVVAGAEYHHLPSVMPMKC